MRPIAIAALLSAFAAGATQAQRVVFVCEHGTVKSLVAEEYFNRLAQERGLGVRAISRGTRPDSLVPTPVAKGLAGDGFDISAFRPQHFTADDLLGGLLVVALDAPVEPVVAGALPVQRWDGLPSVTEQYPVASRAIAAKVRHLVDSLSAARRPR